MYFKRLLWQRSLGTTYPFFSFLAMCCGFYIHHIFILFLNFIKFKCSYIICHFPFLLPKLPHVSFLAFSVTSFSLIVVTYMYVYNWKALPVEDHFSYSEHSPVAHNSLSRVEKLQAFDPLHVGTSIGINIVQILSSHSY